MKLVIDQVELQELQQVELKLGPVSLPLTREQVVQILFGEGYEVRRREDAPQARLPAVARAKALPPVTRAKAPPRTRDPRTVNQRVLEALATGPATLSELVERLGGNVSSAVAGMALHALHKQHKTTREGSRGSFRYSLPDTRALEAGAPAPLALPEAPSSSPRDPGPSINDAVLSFLRENPKSTRGSVAKGLCQFKDKSIFNALDRLTGRKRIVRRESGYGYVYSLSRSANAAMEA